jgi:phosphoribosylformylglycinamidine synthase
MGAVFPTPIIGMVGLIDNPDHITTQMVKHAGDSLILIGGNEQAAFGGSELQKMLFGSVYGDCPGIDLEEAAQLNVRMLEAIQQGLVRSAHDVSEGGLAVCLAEKLFGTGLGAKVSYQAEDPINWLFAEGGHRWVLSTAEPDKVLTLFGAHASLIGEVLAEANLDLWGENLPVASAEQIWAHALDHSVEVAN